MLIAAQHGKPFEPNPHYLSRGEAAPEDDGLSDGFTVLQTPRIHYQGPRRHGTVSLQPSDISADLRKQ